MATTFLTEIPDSGYILTSRLDSIRAITDKEKVEVSVIRDPEGDIDTFFTTTLYPFNGVVELSAISELIELKFRQSGTISDSISVIIDDTSLDFNALYCDHLLPPDFDPEASFWTSSATAIIHPNSAVALAHYPTGSDNYHLKIVGLSPDGTPAMIETDIHSNSDEPLISFPVNDIISLALNQTDFETDDRLSSVAYFSVEHGQMRKTFYIQRHSFFLTFRFRNLFNAPEFLDVVGTVKRKTAVDRESAVSGGITSQYNQVINRTYEVETAPLTPDQALSVEQLVASRDITLIAAAEDHKIIITDHTCEVDNNDSALVKMKFTFRLSSDRPTLLGSELSALVPSRSHIFSQEFTAEFA